MEYAYFKTHLCEYAMVINEAHVLDVGTVVHWSPSSSIMNARDWLKGQAIMYIYPYSVEAHEV